MMINEQVKQQLIEAARKRTSDSFECRIGNLPHFVTSETKKQEAGNYIGTIDVDGTEFKIYMI